MEFFETPEQSDEFAQESLALLKQHGLRPTPKNFTICYAYFGEDYLELKRDLDGIFADKDPLSEERIDELFAQYFELAKQTEAIRATSQKVEKTLASVNEKFGEATRNAAQFGEHLNQFSGKIKESESLDDIQDLVDDMHQKTAVMQESSKALEVDLDESSKELSGAKENLDAVREESMTDSLTGIANQRQFTRFLWDKARAVMAKGGSLSMVLVSVDGFKGFNEEHGIKIANEVLSLVGRILSHNTGDADLAARLEGEKFGLVLPGTSLDGAMDLARKVCASVAERKLVSRGAGKDYGSISLSAGVVLFDQVEYMPQFNKRADAALSQASGKGGGAVVSEREVVIY